MPVPAENTLTVRPVAGHIGAGISGVDLSRPLSAEEARQIRAALLRWKVVFFRRRAVGPGARLHRRAARRTPLRRRRAARGRQRIRPSGQRQSAGRPPSRGACPPGDR
ncbi:TauD/TfdA family dioxygenase [Streptomyces asiaticus]|uniref:TauD/TfdA family dioxygenase n=1 Tax=Streptomyces asiaticus TaxID=114695 RepID=UPI003D705E87